MAIQSKNFISIVALGGQNPQIINVDFLKDNKIIPIDKAPFDQLFRQEKPAKKIISVPGLANLVLGNIEFVIDEGRFQIRETAISEWVETNIIDIAERYFEVLRFTPLKLVGVNLNSMITFETLEEAGKFQELFLSKDSQLAGIVSKGDITASIVLRYPYSGQNNRVTLTIEQPNKENKKRIVNFNYEFDFTDWTNFRSELDKISEIADYADSIVDQLLKAI